MILATVVGFHIAGLLCIELPRERLRDASQVHSGSEAYPGCIWTKWLPSDGPLVALGGRKLLN